VVTCDNCSGPIHVTDEGGSAAAAEPRESSSAHQPTQQGQKKRQKRGGKAAVGWSCTQCFDFDLCVSCYSGGRNAHAAETKHRFKPLQ
jgi:hypothetical protein